MPVDSAIPLQVQHFQGVTPQQMLSLQQMKQQMTMQDLQIQQAQRQQQNQNELRTIFSQPDAIDPETKQPTMGTLQKVMSVDPATGLKMRGDLIAAAEKKATTDKAIAQTQAALANVDKKDRDIMGRLQLETHNLYEQKLDELKDPAAATQAAQQYFSTRLGEEDKLGVLNKRYIQQAQPFDPERSNIMVQAMKPLRADAPEKEVAPTELKKLMDERAALPPGDTRIKVYDDKIRKLNAPTQTMINMGKPAGTGSFEGRNGEILSALAERGVSLPTGFRSKEQQLGLLNGLSKKYADLTGDQIAEKIQKGQLDFSGLKKEVAVAGAAAGKIAYAENEIKEIIPFVREASAKLPRGQFVPYEKLKQMGESAFSNPDLAEFKSYMNTLSNSYDLLAARGGTDMEKRKENRRQFETAQSPEALERVMQVVLKEAQASGRAARTSMDVTRKGDSATPQDRRASDKSNDPLGIR